MQTWRLNLELLRRGKSPVSQAVVMQWSDGNKRMRKKIILNRMTMVVQKRQKGMSFEIWLVAYGCAMQHKDQC